MQEPLTLVISLLFADTHDSKLERSSALSQGLGDGTQALRDALRALSDQGLMEAQFHRTRYERLVEQDGPVDKLKRLVTI